MLERARIIAKDHAILSAELEANYSSKTAKKAGELSETANLLKAWDKAQDSILELDSLLEDKTADAELRALASDELSASRTILQDASTRLRTSLIPKHPFANLPCLIELRPGAGGDEAAIFAADLLKMYQAFCRRLGLKISILKLDAGETAGAEHVQEAVVEIDSEGAYEILRGEAGVHRVQRVPATERTGRVHTSAVSVMVLPAFPDNIADILGENSFDNPESDYYVDPRDVRTDVMRARGAGGQHVNTTDSAVRLTHIPTNTTVAIQDSRSQHKNRQKAWSILRSRIAQSRREVREEEMAQMRLSVIGVAKMGRGDKVRTYNWGQQRVTDHRSGMTVHNLDDVMEGGPHLETVMQSVRAWLIERDLEALTADEQLSKAKKAT